MSTGLAIGIYAASDKGRVREGNEDNFFSGTDVFAVADGMGGHVAGEVASNLAVGPLAEVDGREFTDPAAATDALRTAIEAANSTVIREARANPDHAGMGTTLTAVMVRDGKLHIAHVGDSRAYLLRSGEEIEQLTTDHTLVEELVREGRLSRDEIATHPQRSVITRAIGVDDEVDVDTLPPMALEAGDQVLLCSDGLTGPVREEEIATILTTTAGGQEAVDKLIAAANDAGGPDNITVVLLRVDSGAQARDGAAVEGAAAAAGAAAVGAASVQHDADDTTRIATPEAMPAGPSIAIRTRPEPSGHDFATDFRRYADGRSGRFGAEQEPSPHRWRRIVAGLIGVGVLLAVLGAGGWLLLSRAWFVGVSNERVAIFTGINEAVAGVELYRVHRVTDVTVADLSPRIGERLSGGIPVGSLAEAQATVAAYREQLEPAPTERPTPPPGPGATPTPTPKATPKPRRSPGT